MYTADKARKQTSDNLDARIEKEVRDSIASGRDYGELRVYAEDSFIDNIEEELTKRGFHSIQVPAITLKGDVYFSWASE